MTLLRRANPPATPPYVLIQTDYLGMSNGPPMYSPNAMGCTILVLNGGANSSVGAMAHVSPGDDQLSRCQAVLRQMRDRLVTHYGAYRHDLEFLIAGAMGDPAGFAVGMSNTVAALDIDQEVFDWRSVKNNGIVHGRNRPPVNRGQATALYFYPGVGVYQTYYAHQTVTDPPANAAQMDGVMVKKLKKFVPNFPS